MSCGDLKVGDVCIFIGGDGSALPYLVGSECEIVGEEREYTKKISATDALEVLIVCFGFKIRAAADGKHYICPRRFLRKKDPPKEDDATPRDDFIPAQPEFIEDLQRRLNKKPEIA